MNRKIMFFVVAIFLISFVSAYLPVSELYPSFYDIPDADASSVYEYYPNLHKTHIMSKIDSNLFSESYVFYDELGRTEQTQIKSGGGSIVSSIKYNDLGLQEYVDKPDDYGKFGVKKGEFLGKNVKLNSIKTKSEYGAFGRNEKTLFPDDGEVEMFYGSNWVMTKTKIEDGLYSYTKSISDAFGRQTKVQSDSKDGKNFDNEFNYEYDIKGNLVKIIDAEGHETINTYNSLNQLTSTTHPDTGTTTFAYDLVGNLEMKIDARGIPIKYHYDDLNRMIKVDYPPNEYDSRDKIDDSPTTKDTIREYDYCENGVGRLCYVEDSSGQMEFFYDVRGRVIKEVKTIDALENSKVYTVDHEYDYSGNVKSITISHDSRTEKIEYTYNELGQLESVSFDGKQINSYEYNPSGTLKELDFSLNKLKDIDYEYTDRDWLKELDAANVFKRGYEYNRIGSILKLKEGGDTLSEFHYDLLDRITYVDDEDYYGEDVEYKYDKVGNRQELITLPSGTDFSKKNFANPISLKTYDYGYELGASQANVLLNIGTDVLSYDVVGSLVYFEGVEYFYDEENRLIMVILLDGSTNEYVYDMNGLRAGKKDSNGITFYLYDMGGNVIFEEKVQ